MNAKVESFKNREEDAEAALNKAIIEEQEAMEKLNEDTRTWRPQRQQMNGSLEVVLEERKALVSQYIQKESPIAHRV